MDIKKLKRVSNIINNFVVGNYIADERFPSTIFRIDRIEDGKMTKYTEMVKLCQDEGEYSFKSLIDDKGYNLYSLQRQSWKGVLDEKN